MADKKETMQTKNEVVVAGYLKQIDLEKKKNDDKEDIITGKLVVQWGGVADVVEVKVYKKRLTGEGKVAKAYEKLSDLMNNHTLLGQENEENPKATVVKIYGNGDFTPQIRLNEYAPEGGEVQINPEVSMGFGNIAVDNTDEKSFKGEFDMVIFLNKPPKMEVKNDEETGRLIIEGIFVTYDNLVKPVTFIVEDEDVVEGMQELEKGSTIEVWGNIKIARIVETKAKKSGFGGKAKTDETVTSVSELIITGGESIDEDDKRAIESSFVKKALVEREAFLSKLGEPKETKTKSKGFAGDTKKKPNEDIPF